VAAILKNSMPHNSAAGGPIWIKLGRLMHSVIAMMMRRWKLKPKVQFQHADVCFKKPKAVISQQWI